MAKPLYACPVESYARQVVGGKVAACNLVKLACKRHLADLKSGHKRGLRFDPEASGRAIRFFGEFLKHSKGEWAGQPFILAPWQEFIIGSIFGWKRADGYRRFRLAYNELPRKNGKSTLAAGIGLLLFLGDGEPGAEVYTAATKRDQARIVHSEAVRMVKASADLGQVVAVFKDNLNIPDTASKYEPLGADADTMDGLNIHGAIVDEVHAHKTSAVVDVLETGTGSRRQPLIFEITTAGTDQLSVCRQHHDYSEQVLRGTVHDDTWFAFLACADPGDEWTSPTTWAKANPNLGVSVKLDDLLRKAEKAKNMPAAQNAFMRLHLNIWTQQITRWIPLELWDENSLGPVNEESLAGRTCYGGLDLSSVSDLTAWVLVFPQDDREFIQVLPRFWVPEAKLADPHNRYRDQYQAWARGGWLNATPGDAIDYAFVKAQILEDSRRFNLVDLNIDRLFQAHQLAGELAEEGLDVIGLGQGFLSMSAPTKELERRLLGRKVNHGRHPVLRWCLDNTALKTDPAGNVKPDKERSQAKIDGIVALIMALDRHMRHSGPASVYETRGVLAF